MKCLGLNFWVILAVYSLLSCGGEQSSESDAPNPNETTWRFIDRQLFFASGVSVSSESSAAQEQVKLALRELELETDLGADFFIFQHDDDSLLQPIATETVITGREWKSFVQIWDDQTYNDYITNSVGSVLDPDILAVQNKDNNQEYYIIFRKSCFIAAESCQFASQDHAKSMVWRAFGYIIGMRFGENAASVVMQPGHTDAHTEASEKKKFFAEFDQILESIKVATEPGSDFF